MTVPQTRKLPKSLRKHFERIGPDFLAWMDRRIAILEIGDAELDRLLALRVSLTTADDL
jgi:hypothetical protein